MMLKLMTKFLLECIEVMLKFLFDVDEVFIGDDAEFLLVGDDKVLMLLKFLLVMMRNFYWLVFDVEVFIGVMTQVMTKFLMSNML